MAAHSRNVESDLPRFVLKHCPECGGEREHEATVENRTKATAGVCDENEESPRRSGVYRCVYCHTERRERIR